MAVQLRNEPAVLLGTAATVLTALAEWSGGEITWRALVPLLAGAVIRQFVNGPVSTGKVLDELEDQIDRLQAELENAKASVEGVPVP